VKPSGRKFLRRAGLAAGAVAAALALAIGLSPAKGAAAASVGTAQEPSELAPTVTEVRETALGVARQDGESAPTEVEEAGSTFGEAVDVVRPGQSVPQVTDPRTGKPWSESTVYTVTLKGDFTGDVGVPAGAAAPTGTVLTIMIDAKSGYVVSEDIGDTTPDLHQLSTTVARLEP
jgi:hypothetical protein